MAKPKPQSTHTLAGPIQDRIATQLISQVADANDRLAIAIGVTAFLAVRGGMSRREWHAMCEAAYDAQVDFEAKRHAGQLPMPLLWNAGGSA